ncbi:MAG: phosphoribosyltransferase [Deltaproteobacteria bacterium]|nr:phosphoribosyltransferase [Deltaproteobacteria bacterium]
MWTRFQDRREAGRALGVALAHLAGRPDTLVLGLPRGGVPVAIEVARALGAPLDVCVVRKLGVPGHEELAMGALASGGGAVLNRELIQELGIPPSEIERVAERELAELARRERVLRGAQPPVSVRGRSVILVDDGLATGSTMRAAVKAIRRLEPDRVVVAIPVAPADVCASLEAEVDELVCLSMPESFFAVGLWYEDFRQVSDEQVQELLAEAARWRQTQHPPTASG